MSEKPKGGLPKSHFWVNGVTPMAVGMVMMFFPVFVPPPPGTDGLIIFIAVMPIFYGAIEIRRYRERKAKGELS